MPFVNAMRCKECLREYPVEPINVCEYCFGPLELVYDYEAIRKVISRKRIEQGPFTMWRYKDLLPASGENPVDISAGFTPLVKAQNLGEELGLTNLYLKNDSVNPSFSFKDRGGISCGDQGVGVRVRYASLRFYRQPSLLGGSPCRPRWG